MRSKISTNIWTFIAQDSSEAADRVEAQIFDTFESLARFPLRGRARPELTKLPVRFWTVPKYRNYIVVYRPDTKPLQVVRVLHGRRDLKRTMGG